MKKKVTQKKQNKIHYDFWNHGINPILGYKYELPVNKSFIGANNVLNNY